jgi:hypothetical protein
MSISKEKVLAILDLYMPRMADCIMAGWNDYATIYAPQHHIHTPRTRASIIRDHIVAHVRETFDNVRNVVIIDKRSGLFCLEVKGLVVVRFKKLNEQMRTSNIPTQQALAFEQQMSLPDIPHDAAHINAGYSPDKLWTNLKGIFIAAPNGKKIDWFVEIGDNGKAMPVVELFVQPTPSPASSSSRVRPRAKKSDKRKKAGENR